MIFRKTRVALHGELNGMLLRCCTHLKGHGGVKGTIRMLARRCPSYHFVARFDVARYYKSIRHDILIDILRNMGASAESIAVVESYLRLPDFRTAGTGMTAGGSLSPLLGAVMLTPLDNAMAAMMRKESIFYIRYMDDLVVLAKTRHSFRRTIKRIHEIMHSLQLQLHKKKRFIGKVSAGFDFLGYIVRPGRRLRPSAESLRRLTTRFHRLYEQGASSQRLWCYVERWCGWLWGGLDRLVSRKGGIRGILIQVLRSLGITGFPLPQM